MKYDDVMTVIHRAVEVHILDYYARRREARLPLPSYRAIHDRVVWVATAHRDTLTEDAVGALAAIAGAALAMSLVAGESQVDIVVASMTDDELALARAPVGGTA